MHTRITKYLVGVLQCVWCVVVSGIRMSKDIWVQTRVPVYE